MRGPCVVNLCNPMLCVPHETRYGCSDNSRSAVETVVRLYNTQQLTTITNYNVFTFNIVWQTFTVRSRVWFVETNKNKIHNFTVGTLFFISVPLNSVQRLEPILVAQRPIRKSWYWVLILSDTNRRHLPCGWSVVCKIYNEGKYYVLN